MTAVCLVLTACAEPARTAAGELAAVARTNAKVNYPRVSDAVTGMTGGRSFTAAGRPSGWVSSQAVIPHSSDVVVVYAGAKGAGARSWSARTVVAAGAAQIDRLDRSRNAAEQPRSEAGTTLLGLSVPIVDTQDRYGNEDYVAGPRAIARNYGDSAALLEAMETAGITEVAVRADDLFATRDAAAAKAFGAFMTSLLRNTGTSTVQQDSPRDLPSATCWDSGEEDAGNRYYCFLVHGRYFAQASGAALIEAQQVISAQYAILRAAGS